MIKVTDKAVRRAINTYYEWGAEKLADRLRAALEDAAPHMQQEAVEAWMTVKEAFEEVAKWHDKNAQLCLDVSRDDPRLNEDDRRRAFDAHRHHAASAAAIRLKLTEERRRALEADQ